MTKKLKTPTTNQSVDPNAREKILSAATDLFAEKGLKGTTTRDIARASGLNLSLISYYFGGKEGLYKTIIYEHAMSIKSRMDTIIQRYSQKTLTAEVFEEEIHSIVRSIVELRLQSQSLAKIFMAERIRKMPYSREVFETIMAPAAKKLFEIINEGQRKGILKKDFPPQVFFMVLTEAIFGYFEAADCHFSFWKEAYEMPRDKEKLIDFLTQMFTKGILV